MNHCQFHFHYNLRLKHSAFYLCTNLSNNTEFCLITLIFLKLKYNYIIFPIPFLPSNPIWPLLFSLTDSLLQIDYFNSSFLNSDRQGRFDHHTSCLKHLIISKKTPVCSLRGVLVISFSDLLFSYNNLISYNCIECYKETGFLENPETVLFILKIE